MGEAVDEGDDAGGIGEHGRPVLEGEIGRDDDRSPLFVTRIDDLVEQIGGMVVVREIAKLVDAEQVRPGVESDAPAAKLRRVTRCAVRGVEEKPSPSVGIDTSTNHASATMGSEI